MAILDTQAKSRFKVELQRICPLVFLPITEQICAVPLLVDRGGILDLYFLFEYIVEQKKKGNVVCRCGWAFRNKRKARPTR